jgi:hypothetical protein
MCETADIIASTGTGPVRNERPDLSRCKSSPDFVEPVGEI